MQTTADRMALIRQAHDKFKAKIKVQAKFERDERLWNDAPQYAKQYYGEVYHETTRFDNDWN